MCTYIYIQSYIDIIALHSVLSHSVGIPLQKPSQPRQATGRPFLEYGTMARDDPKGFTGGQPVANVPELTSHPKTHILYELYHVVSLIYTVYIYIYISYPRYLKIWWLHLVVQRLIHTPMKCSQNQPTGVLSTAVTAQIGCPLLPNINQPWHDFALGAWVWRRPRRRGCPVGVETWEIICTRLTHTHTHIYIYISADPGRRKGERARE